MPRTPGPLEWRAAHDVLVEYLREEAEFGKNAEQRIVPVEEVVQFLESQFFDVWGTEALA